MLHSGNIEELTEALRAEIAELRDILDILINQLVNCGLMTYDEYDQWKKLLTERRDANK